MRAHAVKDNESGCCFCRAMQQCFRIHLSNTARNIEDTVRCRTKQYCNVPLTTPGAWCSAHEVEHAFFFLVFFAMMRDGYLASSACDCTRFPTRPYHTSCTNLTCRISSFPATGEDGGDYHFVVGNYSSHSVVVLGYEDASRAA